MINSNCAFYFFCIMIFSLHSVFAKSENNQKKCCDNPIYITSKDINDEKGYIIKCPGHYFLCEDIDFPCHGSKAKAAITIKSSDVLLDLGFNTLSQNSGKKKHKIVGIYAKNVDSISIINGSITDFKGAGIKIENTTDIVLDNLNILRTGKPSSFGGLQINDSSDIVISNLRALENFGCGMYLHGFAKVTITNSHFDDNIGGNVAPQFFPAPGLVGGGAYVDSSDITKSSMILFQDCSFNRNSGGGEGVGMEVGPFSLLPLRDVTILRCEFLDNFMTGEDTLFNDSTGLVFLNVDNFFVKDCIASGQRHPSVPGPIAISAVSGATGFSINSSNNGVIENCQANDNVGQGTTSIGIRVRGCHNVVVKDCECARNINNGSGQAFGFYTDIDGFFDFFQPGLSYVFDSCVAQQNSSVSGLAGGFKISTLSNAIIENCISQENAYGILVNDSGSLQVSVNNIFRNNTVQSNTISGIEDQLVGGNNAYTQNIARTNGAGGISNYVGLPSGTPYVIWSISGAPLVATNPFANLDIVP